MDRYPNTPLVIRFAARGDVPEILRLIRELAEYEQLAEEVVATEEGLEQSLFGTKSCAEVLLAEDEGKIAGFCLFFHNYSTFLAKPGLYIEDIFVRPAHRSKGIGRALLSEVARLGGERGCGRVEWWVLDWNKPAIGFYTSLGAKPMNEWTVYRLTEDQFEHV